MNIMQIVSGTAINGAVMHCLLLTRELARRGHRVMLVARPGAWISTQPVDDRVARVESDLSRWPPRELRRLAEIVRRQRVDVMHTHMSSAHFFGVLLRRLSGVPCVATAHNRYLQLHWMFNDRVIAVSEATRRYQQTRNLVPRARLETIHNFVDHARIAAVPPGARAAMRAQFGIDADAPLIGTIGSVIPRKGLTHLIGALPLLRRAVPGVRLLIAGDEPNGHAAALRAAAAALGVADAIVWARCRTDVPELLAAVDLFVLASTEEPLGLAALEAMAAGLPVVATAVGGLLECVLDGETGLLVQPGDSGALAAAITGLLSDADRRLHLGEAGRRRVREHFGPETQVPRIEAALARVAVSHRVPASPR